MPNYPKEAEKSEVATSHVCEINEAQLEKLRSILESRGWRFEEAPYAHWKAFQDKMNIVAYKSGKLVLQGKGTGEFVLFTLEPEITGEALLGYGPEPEEKTEKKEPFTPHIGIDESGKGDLFGPIVIAAAYVDEKMKETLEKLGVKDSKLIKNDKKIRVLATKIRGVTEGLFSTVAIKPEAYNRLYAKIANLNRLLAWGHARALENMLEKKEGIETAIADKFGGEHLIRQALMGKGKKIRLIQRTKAESDIAVAAASILARDVFVRSLDDLGARLRVTVPRGSGKQASDMLARIVSESQEPAQTLFSSVKFHFKTVQENVPGEILAAVRGKIAEAVRERRTGGPETPGD